MLSPLPEPRTWWQVSGCFLFSNLSTVDKSFQIWNPVEYLVEEKFEERKEKKKEINMKHSRKYFRAGEVWFCSIGLNIGHEQDGKNQYFERPVLIIKKFNDEMFWAVPLTSKLKEGKNYHSLIYKEKRQTAILSQLLRADASRLQRRFFIVSEFALKSVIEKIKLLL